MKKKLLLMILIFLIILIAVLILLKNLYMKKDDVSSNQDNITTVDVVDFNNTRTVSMCKDENNCSILVDSLYSDLTYDYDNKEIQSWIKEVNDETDKYYQETINSNLDDEICASAKENYNYRIVTSGYYNDFINSNYISLAVKRIRLDVCTNKSKIIPTKSFFYSKKKQRQITQEELKEELNLTEDTIIEAIKNNTKIFSSQILEDFDYSNYTLYYDSTGCLLAEYYLPTVDKYYSVTVLY